jgi:hypothetical protein
MQLSKIARMPRTKFMVFFAQDWFPTGYRLNFAAVSASVLREIAETVGQTGKFPIELAGEFRSPGRACRPMLASPDGALFATPLVQ